MLFAGFYGDENDGKDPADFGWKTNRWLQIESILPENVSSEPEFWEASA